MSRDSSDDDEGDLRKALKDTWEYDLHLVVSGAIICAIVLFLIDARLRDRVSAEDSKTITTEEFLRSRSEFVSKLREESAELAERVSVSKAFDGHDNAFSGYTRKLEIFEENDQKRADWSMRIRNGIFVIYIAAIILLTRRRREIRIKHLREGPASLASEKWNGNLNS